MDLWQGILYAVASLLALRSLTTLMSNHRNRVRRDAAIQARLYDMAREVEEQSDAANESLVAASK